MRKLCYANVLFALLLAVVISGCKTPIVVVEKPTVSPTLPDLEEVVLFESDKLSPYFRKSIEVPSGGCEVALDVVAGKVEGAGELQPDEWWHYMGFHRDGRYVTGVYKSPKLVDDVRTFSECYAKVPHGCDVVTFGFGKTKEQAELFHVRSVRLTMARPTAHSLTPAMGLEIADNTPLLTWKSLALRVTVQLSRDTTFPEGATDSRLVLKEKRLQLTTPIAAGVWFWRITTEGGFVSKPQTFVQTIPASEDMSPPVVAVDHRNVTSGTIPLVVTVTDDNGWRITAECNGDPCIIAVSETQKVSVIPEVGWQSGLNRLVITSKDNLGNSEKTLIYVTYSKRSLRMITWTKEGGVTVEGEKKPTLPLGMYMVRASEMAHVKKAGFTVIQHYAADEGDDEMTLKWLDAAQANGLKAFVAFNRKTLYDMDLDGVAERIGALMGHPALLAWYLFDEPDVPKHSVAPYKLEAAYELLKKLDPYHPVLLSCYNESLIPDYAKCFDVFLTQAYHTATSDVFKEIEKTSALLKDVNRVGTIILRNNVPTADPVDNRTSAYLALMHQNGLFFWGWWDDYRMKRVTKNGTERTFHSRFDAVQGNDALKVAFRTEIGELMSELKSVERVFLSDGSIDRFQQGDVYGYVKTTRREIYVVLVCLGDDGAVKYTLSDRGKTKRLTKDEPNSVVVKDQFITVDLKKGQVFILEVR